MRKLLPPALPGVAISIVAVMAFVFGAIALPMPTPLAVIFFILASALLAYEVYSISKKNAAELAENAAIHRRLDAIDAVPIITRAHKKETLRRLHNERRILSQIVVGLEMVTRVDRMVLDGQLAASDPQRAEALQKVKIQENKAWLGYMHHDDDIRFLVEELDRAGLADEALTRLLKRGVKSVSDVEAVLASLGRLLESATEAGSENV
jgi:hypothetical protein